MWFGVGLVVVVGCFHKEPSIQSGDIGELHIIEWIIMLHPGHVCQKDVLINDKWDKKLIFSLYESKSYCDVRGTQMPRPRSG